MAYIVKLIYTEYNFIMEELKDPRVDDWFLVTSPVKIAIGMLAWLYWVKVMGPKWMQNRKPFELEKVMVVYNALQIAICGYMLYQSYDTVLFGYSWTCEAVDYSNSPLALHIASLVWIYFVVKVIDLLDTVFFVLRKKNNQLTFLHLYHHFGMVCTCYVGLKFFAGGQVVFLGFLNCIVHVVMYFYYLLSAWDKGYKKSAWWKKHITQLQLVQFLLIIAFYTPNLFMPDCPLPKFVSLYITTQNIVMLLLFGDFYYGAYIRKKKTLPAPAHASTVTDAVTVTSASTWARVPKSGVDSDADVAGNEQFDRPATSTAPTTKVNGGAQAEGVAAAMLPPPSLSNAKPTKAI